MFFIHTPPWADIILFFFVIVRYWQWHWMLLNRLYFVCTLSCAELAKPIRWNQNLHRLFMYVCIIFEFRKLYLHCMQLPLHECTRKSAFYSQTQKFEILQTRYIGSAYSWENCWCEWLLNRFFYYFGWKYYTLNCIPTNECQSNVVHSMTVYIEEKKKRHGNVC